MRKIVSRIDVENFLVVRGNESDRRWKGAKRVHVRSLDSMQLVSTLENLLAPRRAFGVLVIRSQLGILLGGARTLLQGQINSGLARGQT